MKAVKPKRGDCIPLLLRSPAAHRILARAAEIRARLDAERRKIWPLAQIARLFEISEQLLRQWIKRGLLSKFRRPTEHYRRGITEKVIRKFLNRLGDGAETVGEPKTSRIRPARKKCAAARSAMRSKERLKPSEFAARAGVSVSTVHRLREQGIIRAIRSSPGRWIINGKIF
jgi:hypothetical protein